MKKSFLLIIVICGIFLTGCAQLTNLNDNESDKLAEYMAGNVLRYAKNYEEALIYPSETKDGRNITSDSSIDPVTDQDTTSTNTKDQVTTDTKEITKAPVKNIDGTISVEEIFNHVGDKKYAVSYSGYEDHTSYPHDNDYFTIEPTKGNKLMVISFTIHNNKENSINVNLVNKKINYTLKNISGKNYKPAVSLLTNDIQYLKQTIKGAKSFKAVIVFEVSKKVKADDLSLAIDYNGKSSVINIVK